jgi:hypothetical protein
MVTLNQLKAKFAVGHNSLLVNDASKCINTYSIAVDSIINNETQNQNTAIAADIMFLDKLQTKNQTLADQVKLYLNIAWSLFADSLENEPAKNYLEHSKPR